MESSIFKQIVRYLQEQKKQRRWLAVFLCMALIVGLGTVAALKMRGQAMTRKEKRLVCELEVHQHTDECYADKEKEKLVCGYADYVVHQHNDDCYSQEGELLCTLPEIEKHEHTEECYKEEKNLVCTQEEAEGHQHTGECYSTQPGELQCEVPEHQHEDGCYDEEGTLVCGLEEHQHTEGCFAVEDTLTCQAAEGEGGHTHTEECYETERHLACGKLELHSHTDACYEKIDESREYSEENRRLVCETPVLEEHIHTEEAGCFEIVEPGDEKEEPADDSGDVKEDKKEEKDGEKDKEKEESGDEAVEKPDLTLTAEDEDYTITVTASKEAFPDAKGELTLKVRRLGEDTEEYRTARKLVSEQKKPELPFDIAVEEEGQETPVDLSEKAEKDEEEQSRGITGRHCVFDIVILEDGEEIQPQIPVKVTFKPKSGDGKEIVEEMGGTAEKDGTEERSRRVFHVDTEAATVEDMGAAIDEEGNIVIDTPHFSVFDLVADKEGSVASADSWEVLRKNFYTGEYNGKHIRVTLKGDLEFTGNPIYLDNNRHLTIDLNGYSIFCGEEFVSLDEGMSSEKAMFVVGYSEGGLVIEDTSEAAAGLKDAFLGGLTPSEEKGRTEKDKKLGMIKNETEKEINLIKVGEKGEVTIHGGYLKNARSTIFNIAEQNYEKELIQFTKGYMYSTDLWGDLMHMVNNGGHSSLSVKLNEELECTGKLWLDRARNLTLDLNGHCINVGERADTCVFFVGDNNLESHLTILDSAYENMSQERKAQIDKRGEEALPATEPRLGKYIYEQKTGEYYLTESIPEDDQVHTGEITYRHRLDFNELGAIENTRKEDLGAIIEMHKDGKVTVKSGRFSNAYGSAVASSSYNDENVNLNVEGGYFVGNGQKKARDEGGAIEFKGQGSLTIGEKAVIVANKANIMGGGVRIKGKDNGITENTTADVTIDGAIICSNKAGNGNGSSGGGIYAQDAKVEYHSGYISNNQVDNNQGYETGGGGFYLFWSSLEMKGGYITANKSNMGGGGLMSLNSSFQITAGTIASNRANAEGGGIRIANSSTGIIRIPETDTGSDPVSNPEASGRVYITNNSTTSSVMKENGETRDWGGGGIFIADNGSILRIEAALITDNDAEGFGGGVGGCSTGRIFDEDVESQDPTSVNVNRTAAIYGNHAKGSRLSGGDSSKHDDHDAHNNPFFMKDDGFQDVFSALGCYISSSMLGGGDAKWKGSCDFKPIETPGGLIASTKMLGLTSGSSDEDRGKAVAAAKVVLSGNSSGTHGGGIMCNGILVLGRVENLNFDDSLRVNFRKDYEDKEGNPIDLNKGQFMFALLDAAKFESGYPEQNKLKVAADGKVEYESIPGAVAAYGSNSSDTGWNAQLLVNFKLNEIFSEVLEEGSDYLCGIEDHTHGEACKDGQGTLSCPKEEHTHSPDCRYRKQYSYYLMEVPMGDGGIKYDSAIYKITLNLKKGTRNISMGDGESMKITYLYIDNKIDGGIQVGKLEGDQFSQLLYGNDYSVGYSGDYGGTTGHQGTYINIERTAFTNEAVERPLVFRIFKTNDKGAALNYVPFILHKLDGEGKKIESSNITYTNDNGNLSFTVPNENGSYLLTENVPEGYEDAGPWFVEVEKDKEPQLYYAEERQDETYHKTGKLLEKTEDAEDAFHIVNEEVTYELPKTGGFGLMKYTMAGTLCILLGAGFMYRKKVRERRV